MRIIGGKYRGKNLVSPVNPNVRPTADRTREALFSILRSRLGFDFSSLKLLDVFAGSGALALEALSQGFAEVAMIDLDVGAIDKNLALFPNEKSRAKIIRNDATRLGKATTQYDVLFMDAPYKRNLSEPTLQVLAQNGWLKPGAFCMIELERHEQLNLPSQYEFLQERTYGVAKVVLAQFVS